MSFSDIFKGKGSVNRWPAGAPGGKGGEFAPKGGVGSMGSPFKSFFDQWANVMSGKTTTVSVPSKKETPNSPAPGNSGKITAPQYGGNKPSQGSLFGFGGQSSYGGSTFKPSGPPKGAIPHPKEGEDGKKITINYPSKASAPENWKNANSVVTVTPGSATPISFHGVGMGKWKNPPQTPDEWNKVSGQNPTIDSQHPFEPHPTKHTGAGVLVVEKDGRIWMTKPTNEFGGYKHTFPKGTVEDGINLQASAIKEAYEETGMKVKITGFLGDFERTTSKARYYVAERVGGNPSDMGWESQAIRLANFKAARELLNNHVDKDILDSLEHEMSIGKSYELTIRAAELLVKLRNAGL